MGPRFFSVILLLLVALASTHAAISDASGFAITASAVAPIQGNAAANVSFVDYIRVHVPGLVYITYAAAASSPGVIGEVKVSGSTEAIANLVDVVNNSTAAGPKLELQTTGVAADGAFVLTEVTLFAKNQLKVVAVNSSADVVILDNVLYTKRDATVKKAGSQRRLASDKASDLVVTPAPKTEDSIGRTQQTYYLKPASGVVSDIQHIDLALEVNGTVTLMQMNPDEGDGMYSGFVTVTSNTYIQKMDKFRLSANKSSSSGKDVVKLETAAATSVFDLIQYQVLVQMVSSVTLNFSAIAGMEVTDYRNISYNDRVVITAGGTGDVYIYDPSLTVAANIVGIQSLGSSNVQMDVADIASEDGFFLYAWGTGNVTYLSQSLESQVIMEARDTGRVCSNTKDDLSVVMRSPNTDLVSFTGKKDHKFECTKMEVPKRVPAKAGANEPAAADGAAGKSPTSSTSSAFQGLLSAFMAALALIAVAL